MAVILMYHRVADVAADPFGVTVSTEHFAGHLDVIRSRYRGTSLGQLRSSLSGSGPKHSTVVITFDDGYMDNFTNALPSLLRSDLPATVFVTSGFVGSDAEFWWDRLRTLVLDAVELPASLDLELGGERIQSAVGGALPRSSAYWSMWQRSDPTPRHALFRTLYSRLQLLDEAARARAMHEIELWSECATPSRSSCPVMTAAQVSSMAHVESMEIGGHSHTHPALASLPRGLQRQEIVECRARLEEIIGKQVVSFAYPFGYKGEHYSDETVDIVRESGFTCACAGRPGAVLRGADRFQLPRRVVFDWDGDEFGRQLEEWFWR
jgi:peptidoglycan/xylan/chitin deacetylase (PgdA/CDA1 family)